jgi:signal transduction histidine kinase
VAEQTPPEAELVERVDWLIRLRWLVSICIGLAIALGWLLYPGQFRLLPLATVILTMFFCNALFLAYARSLRVDPTSPPRPRQMTHFAYAQVTLDLLALAALTHLTGGIGSPVTLALVLPVVATGILLPRPAGFLAAGLAVMLYVAIVALEHAQILAHHRPPGLESVELPRQLPYLLTNVIVLAFTLFLVAYIASCIATSLRERERELAANYQTAMEECGELERVNERLRSRDAERTRFMTLVAHELRAPINTIHTCVELALSGHTPPEKVRDILVRVKRRSLELSELVADLLRLARAREEASRDEGIGLVRPAEVLQTVVQLMKAEAASKDLFLSVDISPDLARVRANPERLKLVWTNLLSNAIKYTEPGGIVAVSLRQTPEQLIGTVRDTGIGIPPEDLQRVFEEFYRAENAQEISPVGTGVGLAIVQRIVGSWGGTVSVESEIGLGSKFTIVLPRGEARPEVEVPASS